MNIYFIIILSTVIIAFLLDLVADILNIKNLQTDVPAEFKDIYDDEAYAKSQDYLKTNTYFGFLTGTVNLSVMLLFWFAGGFNYLDSLIFDLSDSEIIRGLIYIGLLVGANAVISLPFKIYSTFVIEQNYGFNTTTVGTFIGDILKSLLLTLLIGLPLLAGILYIFSEYTELAWLYGWAAVSIFSLILQYIAPRFILPLFHKFTELEDGELRKAVFDYAQKVNYPLSNIYVIDGSRRSTKGNAFFTGFGKNKRIALYDTLVRDFTAEEITAVLAHEIGHYKKKHILQSSVIGIIHTGLMFYLLSVFLNHNELYEAFFMEQQSVYAGLIFFGLLYSPIELILSLIMNVFSRRNEYQADKYAGETTKNPDFLISALKKLSRKNLSNLTPHKFYVWMNFSHPTVMNRINELKSIKNYKKN